MSNANSNRRKRTRASLWGSFYGQATQSMRIASAIIAVVLFASTFSSLLAIGVSPASAETVSTPTPTESSTPTSTPPASPEDPEPTESDSAPEPMARAAATDPALPTLEPSFSATDVQTGATTTLKFTITNNNLAAKPGLKFTVTLPTGLKVATPAANVSTCTTKAFTGAAGAAVVTFTGSMAANLASCTVSYNVSSATMADYLIDEAAVTSVTLLNTPAESADVSFTNPTISVSKALGGPRLVSTDQFTVAIRTVSAAGTVVNAVTNSTTTGTGSTVTSGKGVTGDYNAKAGTPYFITEAAVGGATLSNYTTTVACSDSNALQAGLPQGAVFTGSLAITPVAGAAIDCVLTNTQEVTQPWSCTSFGYLFQSPNATTNNVQRIDLVNGTYVNAATTEAPVNAVGFNALDNYFYGVSGTDGIVRINADGSFTRITTAVVSANVGDIDSNGHYWVTSSALSATYYEVDLAPGSATYGKVLSSGPLVAPTGTAPGADWMLSGGNFYTVGSNSTTDLSILIKFDPTTKTFINQGQLLTSAGAASGIKGTFGAGYVDSKGYVYASDNVSGRIYRIDPTTRKTILVSNGPVSSSNDGARCAAAPIPTITVVKQVDGRVATSDQFTVGLKSAAGVVLTSATTAGTATTAATPEWPVSQGSTYTITDAMAAGSSSPLADYSVSVVCTNTVTGLPVTTGGVPGAWTVPVATPDFITCVVTNAAESRTYSVAKTVSETSAIPGDTLGYDITVTNTGTLPYTASIPATFTDNLTAVLDDATYNNDATNGAELAGSTLSWSGVLAVGQSKTIHYTVTVKKPNTANGILTNSVTATGTGGGCVSAASCTTTTRVSAFTYAKTSNAAGPVVPGQKVTYTVTLTNTGAVAFTSGNPATFVDNLSGVLDDATYNADVSAGGSISGTTLNWSGGLPVGGTVQVTYSVTVNDPNTGDGSLKNAVTSTIPGSGCETIGGCIVTNPVRSYTTTKTVDKAVAKQGEVVTYTVTLTNTGTVAYTPATFTDDLSAVLDDATYNGDVSTGGTLIGSALSWSGSLAVGETKDVTYSVTVDDPNTGDGILGNTVVPTTPGGGCADPDACSTDTLVRKLTVVKSSATTDVIPGAVVEYEISIKNTGKVDYDATYLASFTDNLTDILDDADYNNDVQSSTGLGANYSAPVISWSGLLAVGATVTVTYSVEVNDPDTGDNILANAVVTPPGESECDAGSSNPDCSVLIPAGAYSVSKEADKEEVFPGDVVTYTVTVKNTGAIDYTAQAPASFTDNLARVLDDATYNGDATENADITGNVLSWSGALVVGAEVFITYSVTVKNPNSAGDQLLVNVVSPTSPGGRCVTTDDCTTTTDVASYTLSKSADVTTANPGDTVTYTVTVTNTGAVDYAGTDSITFTDDLSDVLDDADYDGNISTGGSFSSPVLSWSGELGAGDTVEVTYSVTVKDDGTGDGNLGNTVVASAPGGDCVPAGSCTTVTLVQSYTVSKTADKTTVEPGQTITFSITLHNPSAVAYTATLPATFTDDLTDVLDDATYNNDVSAGGTVTGNALTFSSALAAGATKVVTYSVTVNDPNNGNHHIGNAVIPTAPGGGCDPAGSCTTVTSVYGFTFSKLASTTTAGPGDSVTYTISVANTGQVPYTNVNPATLTDDLSDVLDDATYTGGLPAGAGITGNILHWSGALPVGDTLVIAYTVTVDRPDAGDHNLRNVVTSTTPGGECDTVGGCETETPVKSFSVSKVASSNTTVPGAVVGYTVTVTNTGTVDYTTPGLATFTDDLTDVLDDATYNGDISAGGSIAGSTLSWSGELLAAQTITVTYSVTVDNPVAGNKRLVNVVVPGIGGDCDTADSCTTDTGVQSFSISKAADSTSVNPGDLLTYTISIVNTGSVDYTSTNPAAFTDDLSGVLDDAVYNNDVSAGGSVTGSTLSWSGAVLAGATATVTYSVTVDNPIRGDFSLKNAVVPTGPGGGCDPAAECATDTPVGQIVVVKTTSATTVTPGDVVPYTITITNVGELAYTVGDPASISDDLSAVLDDATYNGDLVSSTAAGTSFVSPVIRWSGALPLDAVVTLTYSVTVNTPDTGNKKLDNTVVTPPGMGNCAVGSTDPACSSHLPAGDYTVSKSASATSALPGDVITYTVAVVNTGAVAYTLSTPASFTDDLSRVLDDATYNGDVSAGGSISGTTLTWSGVLALDAVIFVTYSVTINDPDLGDHSLDNIVVPTGAGGGCDEGASCETTTTVASFAIAKTSDSATANPGDVVSYEVTVTNTGMVDYTSTYPATFADNLSGVLDDASYNNDVSTGGVVTGSTLTWSGAVPVGESVVVSYSVTIKDPDNGDKHLKNTVSTTGPGGGCESAADCVTDTAVQSFTFSKTSSVATVTPGNTVTYTLTVKNTGAVAYTAGDPIVLTDDLSDVLDDATYNNDVSTGGSIAGSVLTWSGALAAGATATVNYSVTVDSPRTGDSVLGNTVVSATPGGECEPGASCETSTNILSFTVSKVASATTANPGDVVTYTISVVNTGSTAYSTAAPASFSDDLSDVLDDASYNEDISTGGHVTGVALTWSGALEVGETVAVTYSVTVKDSVTGNHSLNNVVVPTGDGGDCDPAGNCATDTPVESFTVSKVADSTITTPGSVVTYSVTVTNTGKVPYTAIRPASFTDDLSAVLDDASYNGDVSAGGSVTGTTLAWSGALAIGAEVTVTYSVTVDVLTGDGVIENVVTADGPGGDCDPAADCETTTPVQSFTVAKSSSATSAAPGAKVTYTVTVTNTGKVAYTAGSPASFSDDLSGVLDDASYNDDVSSGGIVAGNSLTWSGALAVGATATVSYSVTIDAFVNGDHILANVVVPTGPGGDCDPAADCETDTPIATFDVVKTTTATTVTPGAVVDYTITVTNTGEVDYTTGTKASFSDSLADVLDDAVYNGDVLSSTGSGTNYSAPVISWSGPLAIGATVSVTYSVTVNTPDVGDHRLLNAVVTPPGLGGNCATGSTDPDCVSQVPAASYEVSKVASAATAAPGESITYAVTVKNTGKVDYTTQDPAAFSDDLSRVLDDASYNNDATGGAVFTTPMLDWSGALATGTSVTITYSVTINAPDVGDHSLLNVVVPATPGGDCADCSTTTGVEGFTVSKSVDAAVVVPGQKVSYSITVTNTGSVDYTILHPARFSDDLSQVLDDATYNGDVSVGGTLSGSVLTWSGPLAIGATRTVTYSVTVNSPDLGDHQLINVVVPVGPGGGCAVGETCGTTSDVRDFSVSKKASTASVKPGDTVVYTITVKNIGALDYPVDEPVSFTDNLTNVLKSAVYNDDASEGATYAAPVLSWSAPLVVGATAVITYSITVNDDAVSGTMRNVVVTPLGQSEYCQLDAGQPDCETATAIMTPETPDTPDSPLLAFTGSNPAPAIAFAAMLVALGIWLLGSNAYARRRRARS